MSGIESRRRRLLWIAIAALLVLGPLFFNLARAPHFETSIELFPRPVAPYPADADPRYFLALLSDPELRHQMQLHVGLGAASYRDVTIRPDRTLGALTLGVIAKTPANAQRFVNALGPQIVQATRRQLGRQAVRDTEALRARLQTHMARKRRRTLQRQLRRLERFGEFPPSRVVLGRPAPRPRLERWADRFADALPGDFAGRPSPGWAALAGLFITATLWAISLAFVAPGRRRSDLAGPRPDSSGHAAG